MTKLIYSKRFDLIDYDIGTNIVDIIKIMRLLTIN